MTPSGDRPFVEIERQPGRMLVRVYLRTFPGDAEFIGLQEQVLRSLPATGPVFLDLSGVRFVPGIFVGVLLRLHRDLLEMNRPLVLCRLSVELRELLDVLRLSGLFDLRHDIPDLDMNFPSPQEAAFLASIRETPDDDTPRLIFADWLEEEGGDGLRAELIRGQCALSRGSEDESLARRVGELIAAHGRRWAGSLAGLVMAWGFRRGMIESVDLACQVLADHGDDLLRLAPIRVVRLRGRGGLNSLDGLGCLARIEELDLRSLIAGADQVGAVLPGLTLPGTCRIRVRRMQLRENDSSAQILGNRLIVEE